MPREFNPDRFFTARDIINEVKIDTGDDYGVLQRRYRHWLFRIWKEINRRFLRTTRKVILPVNDMGIVEMPADFLEEIFIGYFDDCRNLQPLAINRNLMPMRGVDDQRVICDSCHSESLCNILEVEVATEEVVISNIEYTKTITKTLHPSGAYILEVEEPVAKYENGVITEINMRKTKEVICELPVLECGCIPPSEKNLTALCNCGSMNAYKCCCSQADNFFPVQEGAYGSVMMFKEEGFFQLSPGSCLNGLYVEYVGNGLFKNGQFYFPEIAFEALIAGVYWRSIEKKKNVSRGDRHDARRAYYSQLKLMHRDLTRQSIQRILEAFNTIPRIAA